MKKFWSLMLVALVTLGAAACTEKDENVDTKQEATVSFYAEIADDTRAVISDKDGDKTWTTTFEEFDALCVSLKSDPNKKFKFVHDGEKFNNTTAGASVLLGQTVTISIVDGNRDSKAGKKGWSINSTDVENFDNGVRVKLASDTSFFRYTYNGDSDITFTVTADTNVFQYDGNSYNTITFSGVKGENFIPFWTQNSNPIDATVAYYVDGAKCKELTTTLAPGKVYNMKTLEAAKDLVVNEMFGIVGGHQGWDTANVDELYLIPGTNTYVRYNVAVTKDGFKLYGSKSETIIVEHPAVTTGEEGDYYLVPNSNWKQANARFAIYFFGNGETWVSMKDDNGDGIYAANKPADDKTYPSMIFCRMNPSATANNWNNKWNQTGDLTCPKDGKNCFTVPSGIWDGATTTWSVHTPEVKDAWTEEVEEITPYWFGKKSGENISNWTQRWSNETDGTGDNITVTDTTKTYDIYFSKGADQDWGFDAFYAVREHGSEAPTLK